MSASAQGAEPCYICGHPVDQTEVERLLLEDEGVIVKVQPFRICVDCTIAFRDGKLTHPFVRWYTTQPAP